MAPFWVGKLLELFNPNSSNNSNNRRKVLLKKTCLLTLTMMRSLRLQHQKRTKTMLRIQQKQKKKKRQKRHPKMLPRFKLLFRQKSSSLLCNTLSSQSTSAFSRRWCLQVRRWNARTDFSVCFTLGCYSLRLLWTFLGFNAEVGYLTSVSQGDVNVITAVMLSGRKQSVKNLDNCTLGAIGIDSNKH